MRLQRKAMGGERKRSSGGGRDGWRKFNRKERTDRKGAGVWFRGDAGGERLEGASRRMKWAGARTDRTGAANQASLRDAAYWGRMRGLKPTPTFTRSLCESVWAEDGRGSRAVSVAWAKIG